MRGENVIDTNKKGFHEHAFYFMSKAEKFALI
jgi:hypothetical protein